MVRDWNLQESLSSDRIYKGSATASFSAPDGEVSGPATLTIPSDGHVTLELEIQQHSIPPDYNDFLMPFLLDQVPEPIAAGGREFRDHGSQEIRAVGLQTEHGTFQASRGIVTKKHFSMFSNDGSSITVVPNDLMFVPLEQIPEEVWCLPLFGMLSEFQGVETASSIVDHAPYIPFVTDGSLCGLEIFAPAVKTPSHECSGVAFGVIGNRPHDTADEIRNLLPSGLIAALSFASGSDINAPWLELRSIDGRLGRRVYARIGSTPQKDNFPAFTRVDSARLGSGVGPFLNCYFGLPLEARNRLIVPLNLVRSGTPGKATVDESITDLVKALDAVCKLHGFDRRNLRLGLAPQESAEVKAILDAARSDLKRLRKQWKADHRQSQVPILDRIVSRQANVDSEDLDFGLAVADLLRGFGLSDAGAMNAYYSTLSQDITWEGLLSTVRGEVIHSGAIHIRDRGGLLGWFEFALHLHDICKRLILRQVGYTGTYAASNVRYKGQYEIDRVKLSTTVQQLGYSLPPASI
ncbi:MAG TPA: hypothetical protein VFQ24_12635 [Terriglobia bacterium]|nr:hypothetical protein [Terriglobia bacterium]